MPPRPPSSVILSRLTPGAARPVIRVQPWKTFWPLKAESYSQEQRADMPWLTWKPNPQQPDEKPWRQWRLENQSCVTRRGANF
ncbi:hypothetical protein CONLIGDRAFT_627856 [Coniochaeta ligniaria NRRL 30616]|uniref:Uncharacterized protein n=1 Tax=Coniochaeta ligniaria NRRL 30616 TaxID=1408157 RepID=A0A1J7J0K3_9PEZI|nr:hypothetical protein CONLIGDRAFT_627856 [Coniochaeta ligniaria NRRL 30616]